MKEFVGCKFDLALPSTVWCALLLFQKKYDDSLRMCVDYKALNKATIKNKYPIPLVVELFNRLSRATYFTELNLRSGYWQVQIVEGDEGKNCLCNLVWSILVSNNVVWANQCPNNLL